LMQCGGWKRACVVEEGIEQLRDPGGVHGS